MQSSEPRETTCEALLSEIIPPALQLIRLHDDLYGGEIPEPLEELVEWENGQQVFREEGKNALRGILHDLEGSYRRAWRMENDCVMGSAGQSLAVAVQPDLEGATVGLAALVSEHDLAVPPIVVLSRIHDHLRSVMRRVGVLPAVS